MTKHWLNSLRRSFKNRTLNRIAKPRLAKPRLEANLRSLETLERREVPAVDFTPGNITVLRAGDGVETLTDKGNTIFVDEYKLDGTFVQSVQLPTSGSKQLAINGNSPASGFMQLSGDGKYLSIPGYNSPPSQPTSIVATTAATLNRAVLIIGADADGPADDFATATYLSINNFANNGAIRSAVTNNGLDVYVTTNTGGIGYAKFGNPGVDTPTLSTSPTTNLRNVQIYGGQLYVTSGTTTSGGTRIAAVGTGVPTTSGQTQVNLNGIPWTYSPGISNSIYGIYMADLDSGVAGIDTVYWADDGGFGTGTRGLHKATFNGTTWAENGTAIDNVSIGLRGLTGSVSGSTVTLIGTTSDSKIVKFIDDSGFNGNLTAATTPTMSVIATAPTGTSFRGVTFAPNNVQTNVIGVASAPTTINTSSTSFTVSFNSAVTGLTASNLSVTTTGDLSDIAGNITIGTPTTLNGLDWTVPVSGLFDDGTVRLNVANSAGISPTPGAVPFLSGTTVTVDLEQVGAYIDIVNGNAVFHGGKGISNNVTMDTSGSSVTLNDSVETITVTAAAATAGWTGHGTNTVKNASGSVPLLKVRLGTGVDTVTVNKVNVPLNVTGGSQAGDNANFPVSLTYAGAVSFTGFDSIAVSSGVTVAIDSVTLGASAIGGAGTPVRTNAKSVTAISTGPNGINLEEVNGADFTFTASGGGSVNIETLAGALTIAGASTWDTGTVTLKSPDDVIINANVGTALVTTGGLVIMANADGAGSQGFTQSTTAKLNTTTTGSFSITVNTPSGGTGDAVLGQGRTDSLGFTYVDVNGGDILWNPGFVIPAQNLANTEVLISGAFTLKTSGAASSVGNVASPLQLNANKLSGLTDAVAGTGGVYITRAGSGTAPFTASATGAGDIQLWSRSGSNTSIEVAASGGPSGLGGLHTDTGSIWVRSWKYIQVNGIIGGLNALTSNNMSGTILLEANIAGTDSQLIYQTADIVTANSTANAVVMRSSGSTNSAAFGVGGIRLANVSVGAGGTITVDAAYLLGTGSDSVRAGAISRFAGTTLSAPGGAVILNAKDDHIGTAGQPITIDAASVVATTNSTNTVITTLGSVTSPFNTEQDDGDIWLTLTSAATNVAATTTTAASIDTATVTRVGDVSITATTGSLTVNGKTKTDTGNIDVTSASSLGLGADLGDGTTGPITLNTSGPITQTAGVVNTSGVLTLNAPGNTATFVSTGNKAGTLMIPLSVTCLVDGTFDPAGAVQVDGTLGGKGSVGTVTVMATGKVTPGTSPGKLGTGNIVFNSGSVFHVELNGGVAGVSYDQLAVTGTVDLGNATLTGSLGFVPSSGQIFRIIDNDGSDTITTTFNGYAEGATVVIGLTNFTISYKGGDGNDVTLKAPGIAAAPKISGITFGDGSAQRSMVNQMIVNFSEPVTFSGDVTAAFTLSRMTIGSNGLPQDGGTTGAVGLIASPISGTASSVTITFVANSNQTSFGSLRDGFYDMVIDADQISGPGGLLDGENNPTFPSGNGTPGGDYIVTGTTSNKYFRLFGDRDGNGVTGLNDFGNFFASFNTTYDPAFDYENNLGLTGLADFAQFSKRFNFTP